MFNFHCHKCSESFRVSIEKLYNKDAIKCNNCDHPLPDDAIKALNRLGEAYLDVIDVLHRTGEYKDCWSVSVIEDSELTPKPVSEYDIFVNTYDDRKEESYWSHRRESKSITNQETF